MSELRMGQLRRSFFRRRLDGLLVTHQPNVRYLTGFTGGSGSLVVSEEGALLVTDFRYQTQAEKEIQGCELLISTDFGKVARWLRRHGVRRLGFEKECVTVARHERLRKKLGGTRLVATQGLVERLRQVKDVAEIATLRRAVAASDAAYEFIMGVLRPGMTEREVAAELEYQMVQQGASKAAFDTIVASGPRSALPHGTASPRRLEAGDLVKMDFGAVVDGYCSDLTRTVCLGRPSAKQQRVYSIVRSAQLRALDCLAAGRMAKEVDAAARDYIESKGYGKEFGHGLGHAVGLEIHEAPSLAKNSRRRLKTGMALTVEPGLYVADWGGVRIEDVAVVSDARCEVLTHAEKPPRIPSL